MKTIKSKLFTFALAIFLTACSDSAEIKLIKKGKLNNYPEKTIGEAVDGFFGSPEWETVKASDGFTYVNVSGIITYMEKEVNGRLQFKVLEDGQSFEVNAFEMNEIPQNRLMLVGIISKMFEK